MFSSLSTHLQKSSASLLSEYDFILCSTEDDLQQTLQLRIDVFHTEQGFPADTEIDEYDPISAHFNMIRRDNKSVVATVRLTPYPRKQWLKQVSDSFNQPFNSPGMKQDETSMVTSGGGPQGSSGGLPMFSTSSSNGNDDGQQLLGTKSKGAPAEASDDQAARKRFPLGRPLQSAKLKGMFQQSVLQNGAKTNNGLHDKDDEEEQGAPRVRGAKISRLAVSRNQRGKGLGKLTMQQAEGWLSSMMRDINAQHSDSNDNDNGKDTSFGQMNIVISSQQHAVPFYEALGYGVVGDPYDEEGAPHRWCVKQLSNPLQT